MLPILRLIPVGGVSLAIMILILALSPPGGPRPPLPRTVMPARGALIARADHPEWRQLLVYAALRRADELSQLRQLPDTPTESGNTPADAKNENPQKADEVAGVQIARGLAAGHEHPAGRGGSGRGDHAGGVYRESVRRTTAGCLPSGTNTDLGAAARCWQVQFEQRVTDRCAGGRLGTRVAW